MSTGGVYSISTTQRVAILDIDFASRPTVTLVLVEGTPGGKKASVGVGGVVTFNGDPFTVTQICTGHVELTHGRPTS